MNTFEAVLLGCVGGAIPDVLRLIGNRYGDVPEYLGRPFFWFSLALLIVVGGVAVYLSKPTEAIQALAIGFSAPEVLSRLLKREPPRPAPPGPPAIDGDGQTANAHVVRPTSLRDYWAA